jgi:hypothetical protein
MYSSFYFRGIAEVSDTVTFITLRDIELIKNSGQKPPHHGPDRVKTFWSILPTKKWES